MPPRYLKKSARAEAQAARKTGGREARRARYDPDAPTTTSERQRAEANAAAGGGHDRAAAMGSSGGGSSDPVLTLRPNYSGARLTREELRARLAARVAEIRTRQGAAKAARDWQARARAASSAGTPKTDRADRVASAPAPATAAGPVVADGESGSAPAAGAIAGADGDGAALLFSKVDLGGADKRRGRKRPETKTQLLEKAVAERDRIRALGDTDEGKARWRGFTGAVPPTFTCPPFPLEAYQTLPAPTRASTMTHRLGWPD